MKHVFTCFSRSPSQNHDELDNLRTKLNYQIKCSELNYLLTNINNNQPACSIVIDDFNAKCSKWCSNDKNNIAGLEIDNITTTAAYFQVINK